MSNKIYLILFLVFFSISNLFAQSGDRFHKHSVMRGNLVKTVFGNWGVIGQPDYVGSRGAWIYDDNGYIGDVSPLVGVEVTTVDTAGKSIKYHSTVTCPIARPTMANETSRKGLSWTFEPVSGYLNDKQNNIALYSDPESWPAIWPDKLNDPNDPGWAGDWNGFFGKTTTASEEAYFVMDDDADEEFNFANNNKWGVAFKPDSMNTNRNGLGLEVKVRAMQWRDFLAQDNIFWLYEITNNSTTDYAQVVFGMLVGTYVGVSSTENFFEYNDDYSFYDVEEDIVFTADYDDDASRNPRWKGDVGVVGYAFLESPGNDHDGIDNDGDANDNPIYPATGTYFIEQDFEPRTLDEGDAIIIINDKYERHTEYVQEDGHIVYTRGSEAIFIEPGVTSLVEGNLIEDRDGNEILNNNAYDGVDNDLDGLVDENYYLHFHQIRKDQNGKVLLDKFSPVRYKDYFTGLGVDDYLIDEGRADGIDNDGDWNIEFDDIGADGLFNTGDQGEGDGMPTTGEPNFDKTDVDESDQIGLTSFQYFSPAGEVNLSDDEELWGRVKPGLFDVQKTIINEKPIQGEDGDFFYGSGYFPLLAGETKWFSLALVYGEGGGAQVDLVDLMKNRKTVQEIYNNDYRFPPAPDKPTLTAIAGDGKVTLYWDRKAEESFDPILKIKDFEGYKIYKATDHNFNDIFNITDADGIITSYKPLAQYDLKDGIKGYFYPAYDLHQNFAALSFNLGNDTGLQHSFVDYDVENGRRYYYAVVAYDHGDPAADVFPKENNFRIDVSPSGEVKTFQNTAVVIPNAPVAGYDPIIMPDSLVIIDPVKAIGTGNLYYKVIDDQAVNARYEKATSEFDVPPSYLIEFWDSSNDGVDNDNDWDNSIHDVGSDGIANTQDSDGTENNNIPNIGEPNIDINDLDEWFVPITSYYRVRDIVGVTEPFIARDTFVVNLPHKNLIEETIIVKDESDNIINISDYIIDAAFGSIKGKTTNKLLYGADYSISYQYYPVYKSPFMENSIYEKNVKDTDIFDGIQLYFQNDWEIKINKAATGWADTSKAMDYTMKAFSTGVEEVGKKHPSNYELQFFNEPVYHSMTMPNDASVTSIFINFKIYNMTDSTYIDFVFNEVDADGKGLLSDLDNIIFFETGANNDTVITWEMLFLEKDKNVIYDYNANDRLTIVMDKPYRSGDALQFKTIKPEIKRTAAKSEMNNIKVVPNPYIVATSHELPLPPAITSGRGERKIDFIHLPIDAKISIFTARGEHVITKEHDSFIHDGTVSWNLKTKENLDIAPGIYFYVVESSIGVKKGKIAIIK